MTFLKFITYEVAELTANIKHFKKTYPEFLNEEVSIYVDEHDDLYMQLFDWYDEDNRIPIPKNYWNSAK